jgi:hypothetical protein
VEAYLESYLKSAPPLLTAEVAGASLVELVKSDAASVAPAYVLAGGGLKALP